MWAMMPMLRVRSSGNSRLAISVSSSTSVVTSAQGGGSRACGRDRRNRPRARCSMLPAAARRSRVGRTAHRPSAAVVDRRRRSRCVVGWPPGRGGGRWGWSRARGEGTAAAAAPATISAAPVRRVQAHLQVGAVDDPLEREADEVADRLVASLAADQRGATPPSPTAPETRSSPARIRGGAAPLAQRRSTVRCHGHPDPTAVGRLGPANRTRRRWARPRHRVDAQLATRSGPVAWTAPPRVKRGAAPRRGLRRRAGARRRRVAGAQPAHVGRGVHDRQRHLLLRTGAGCLVGERARACWPTS